MGNRARSLVLGIVVVWSLAASIACAQTDEAAYRDVITEAVAEFDAHRFEEARALFTRAHTMSPSARTLRGIGMTSFEMRDYAEAHRSLSAALVATARPLTPEQSAEVRALLERTSHFLAVLTVDVVPPSATLSVGGRAAATDDAGHVLLGLGTHELVARADGYTEVRRTIDVRGGETEAISLRLEPEVSAADLPPPAVSDVAPLPSGRSASDATPGIALVVVGGVVVVAAVIVGVAAWLTRDEQIGVCVAAGPDCDNLDTLRGERDASAGVTIALAVAGAASLVIGGVILASSGGTGDHASLACMPSLGGVACAGRF